MNISTECEIGHFEPCSTVTSPATTSLASGVTDTYWKHCMGAYEKHHGARQREEPGDQRRPVLPAG